MVTFRLCRSHARDGMDQQERQRSSGRGGRCSTARFLPAPRRIANAGSLEEPRHSEQPQTAEETGNRAIGLNRQERQGRQVKQFTDRGRVACKTIGASAGLGLLSLDLIFAPLAFLAVRLLS